MNRKIIKYMLAGAVGVQLFVIFCCNYFKAFDMLDYDSAMAVRHAVEMWRNGTVFLKDFGYTTSMEIDCAAFLAAPVYILTGNYGLGIAISHLLLDGILAYLIYQILKNLNVTYEFRILGILLILLPYKYGQLEWSNMIFLAVGQYEFRVISACFLFMMLSYKKKWNKKCWIGYGVGQIFIFITVLSTGNYFIITVLAPLLLYEIFRILKQERLNWRDRDLNIVIWSTATALLAYGINKGMHIATARSNMHILKDTEFADNILDCLTGVVALFGGLATWDVPVLSLEGIGYLVRFLLLCILLILGIAVIIRRDKLRENNAFLERFFLLFLINMLVLLYTNTRYGSAVFEVRYHIIWCILMIIADVMLFSVMWRGFGAWIKATAITCMMIGIFIINLSGFGTIWNVTNIDEPVITRSIQIADEHGISDVVVVDGGVARKMGAMHINKNVQFGVLDETSGMIGFNTWGSLLDTSVQKANILLIRDSDVPQLAEDIKEDYQVMEVKDGWMILLTRSHEW